MKRKELTKTFMMILNWKKHLISSGLFKNISAPKDYNEHDFQTGLLFQYPVVIYICGAKKVN